MPTSGRAGAGRARLSISTSGWSRRRRTRSPANSATGQGRARGVEASWTDRNFFNPEGALTLRGIAGTSEQLLGVQFRRSNFLQRDQTLNLQFSASHQKFAAYKAKTVDLAGQYRAAEQLHLAEEVDLVLRRRVARDRRARRFQQRRASRTRGPSSSPPLPLSLGYDGSDNLLDPTRGFRLSGRVSPEISVARRPASPMRAPSSTRAPISRFRDHVVVAGRVRLGTIFGAGVFDIAPSRRFYSGGGGSVRGYGYQQLGPKDADGDPIGGRGLAEFGLEARIRLKQFGGNFGIVPFFDGGSLTTEAMPDFKNWRFAAGVGVRYYSSFGPIRVDFGVPLNRQKGDGPFAVTVSLGQAF